MPEKKPGEKSERTEVQEGRVRRQIVGDIIQRLEVAGTIDEGNVRYFNQVDANRLANPQEELDTAIRIVRTADQTGTLNDLKALIEE